MNGFWKLKYKYAKWQLKLMPGLLIGLVLFGGAFAIIKSINPDFFLPENKDISLIFYLLGIIITIALSWLSLKVINNIKKSRAGKNETKSAPDEE